MSQSFSGSRRLEVLCYLLVWTGAAALLLVPKGAPQMVLVFCLAIAPSCFLHVPAQRTTAYRTVWRLVTVAFIFGSLLDWRLNGRELVQTLVAQMCFFQTYKAYNFKTHSDYLQMVLFAALMVAFCGLVSDSVFFVMVLVPFVSILVAFLWTLNLSRNYLGTGPTRARRRDVLVAAGVGYQVGGGRVVSRTLAIPRVAWALQTLAVFAAAIAAFYALPRRHVYSPSHFGNSGPLKGLDPVVSGLSGGVSLNHLSQIKSDARPVLKVTFPDKVPPQEALYLRSCSLERLSNLEWSRVAPTPSIEKQDSAGIFWLQSVRDADRHLLIPHIVEHINGVGRAPITLPDLVAIDRVEKGLPRGRIGAIGHLTSLERYRAFSWDPQASTRPPVKPVSEEIWTKSLELPDDLTTLSVYQLAIEITYGFADNLSRAEAIQEHLRTNYGYTLNIGPLDGHAGTPNPIARFLFDYRKGNCEVVASAMVVLCRNVHVPARLAIGYHGGVPGDAPNEFIFRNQDAHTWVEVWSEEYGWVTFDPTPPPPLQVYHGRFSFKKIMEWFGSATARWNRMVVWYDNEAKARWMSYLWNPIERWALNSQWDGTILGRLGPRLRENIGRPQILALLVALLLINVTAAVLYIRARRRWLAPGSNQARRLRNDPWLKFYFAAVNVLCGRISRRRLAQTPGEFLEALARDRSLDPHELQAVVRLYHKGRFGGVAWDRGVALEADHLLRQLARSVESRKR